MTSSSLDELKLFTFSPNISTSSSESTSSNDSSGWDELAGELMTKADHPIPEGRTPIPMSSLKPWCLPNEAGYDVEPSRTERDGQLRIRFCNPFFLLRKHVSAIVEHLGGKDISKLTGAIWARLPDEAKRLWKAAEVAMKVRYWEKNPHVKDAMAAKKSKRFNSRGCDCRRNRRREISIKEELLNSTAPFQLFTPKQRARFRNLSHRALPLPVFPSRSSPAEGSSSSISSTPDLMSRVATPSLTFEASSFTSAMTSVTFPLNSLDVDLQPNPFETAAAVSPPANNFYPAETLHTFTSGDISISAYDEQFHTFDSGALPQNLNDFPVIEHLSIPESTDQLEFDATQYINSLFP